MREDRGGLITLVLTFLWTIQLFYLCNPLPWESAKNAVLRHVSPLLTTSKSLLWLCKKEQRKVRKSTKLIWLINSEIIPELALGWYFGLRLAFSFLNHPLYENLTWEVDACWEAVRQGAVVQRRHLSLPWRHGMLADGPIAFTLDQERCGASCLLSWYCGSWIPSGQSKDVWAQGQRSVSGEGPHEASLTPGPVVGKK